MELGPRFDGRARAAWFRLAPETWWRGSPIEAIEAALDEAEARAALEAAEGAREYPRDAIGRARRAGLASILVGEHATIPHACALNAMVARRSGSLAITLGVNFLALLPLHVAASDALLARVRSRVEAGSFCGLLLTELAHGSNLLRIETRAAREGEGTRQASWTLRGEKHLINGGTEHDLLVTLARTRERTTDPASALASRADLTLFVVERDPSVVALPRWRTLPAHAADIAGVRFDGTRVDDDAIVGAEGEGFGVVQKTLALSRGGIGALASGAASDAFDRALHHAKTRDVYGGPILELGAIAHHVMRIAALEALAAATSVQAAALSNAIGTGAAHATNIAKLACCALAEEAVDEGRRVLGARALVEEAGYARLARDVLLYGVFDGTSHVVLDQAQWRLAQFAASERPNDEDASIREHLAFAKDAFARPPRSMRDAARERARTYLAPIDQRLRALASLASPLDVAPLVTAADSLLDFVRARRAAGAWDVDQATRFEAAHALAELEALAALVLLGDPARREAIGLAPTQDAARDAAVVAFALAWFAPRVLSRIERLASIDLSSGRGRLARTESHARAWLGDFLRR